RPQEAPGQAGGMGGFSGAKSAWLLRDVHIHARNVGRGGILPGTNKAQVGAETPLDLTCASFMRIDLPKPLPPRKPGDPEPPPQPAFAHFERHVRVVRGQGKSDHIYGDRLDLELRPGPRPPATIVATTQIAAFAVAEAAPVPEGDEEEEAAGAGGVDD